MAGDDSVWCERSRIKYAFIQVQQKMYSVNVLCRVMEVSTSAYYAWSHTSATGNKTQQNQVLADKVRKFFTDNDSALSDAEELYASAKLVFKLIFRVCGIVST